MTDGIWSRIKLGVQGIAIQSSVYFWAKSIANHGGLKVKWYQPRLFANSFIH